MSSPGPTALPTRPRVEAPTDETEIRAFTVVTGPPEKQPSMAPGALATEAATVAQPPSHTDGAEATVVEATVAEATVVGATVAEATVAESIVPVVSTVARTAHLVTDSPMVETAAPATAAEDVKPAQTAAAEANGAVVIEEGADEVNGKKCAGWAGKWSGGH